MDIPESIKTRKYYYVQGLLVSELDIIYGNSDNLFEKTLLDNINPFKIDKDYVCITYGEYMEILFEEAKKSGDMFKVIGMLRFVNNNRLVKQEYVYAVNDEDGFMKIGRTGNKKQREKSLTDRYDYLGEFTWFECLDSVRTEKIIHNKLDSYRMHGEWFDVERVYVESIIKETIEQVNVEFIINKVKKDKEMSKSVYVLTEDGCMKLLNMVGEKNLEPLHKCFCHYDKGVNYEKIEFIKKFFDVFDNENSYEEVREEYIKMVMSIVLNCETVDDITNSLKRACLIRDVFIEHIKADPELAESLEMGWTEEQRELFLNENRYRWS